MDNKIKVTGNAISKKFYWDNGAYLGCTTLDIDGYYYFNTNVNGNWSAYALRCIAEKLDELNKDWDEKVKQNLNKIV